MTGRTSLLPLLVTVLAGARPLAGQATTPPAQPPYNWSSYFSIGDSLAAGFMSNALVETRQAHSVPALLARQAGVADFQQPLVTEPGIPPEFALIRLSPAPLIAPKAATPGRLRNPALARPYNNLAVPGATVIDAATRTTDGGGFHDLILRGRGTQVAQAAGARPTVVTLWIGNNDVVGAAIRGRAVEGVTLTPAAAFRAAYQQIVSVLRAAEARVVAANLPDPTVIPFVTTVPRVVTSPTGDPVLVNGQPVPLLGPQGPLPPGSYVTLAATSLLAQGHGIPEALGGRGTPLPDEAVLDAGEVASIRARVEENNRAIAEICQGAGIPVLDVNALVRELHERGRNVGGVVLTSAFLTGGIFSYDGVHPNELGYAIVANEWIRVINASGGELDEVDLAPFMGFGGASAAAARAGGRARAAATAELDREAWEALLLAFPTVDGR